MEANTSRIEVKRIELYDLVWSEPMADVAQRYAVSVDFIKRLCGLLSVPVPKSGHWRRVKTPRKLMLPRVAQSAPVSLWLIDKGSKRKIDTSVSGPGIAEHVPKLNVKGPHPLTMRAQAYYEFPTLGNNGLMKSKGKSAPFLKVSEAQKVRALRVTDQLIKAIEKAGFRVEWKGNMTVQTPEGEMRIAIREVTENVEVSTPIPEPSRNRRIFYSWTLRANCEERPSGVLSVSFTNAHWDIALTSEWKDEKKLTVEKRIAEIVEMLPQYAKARRLKIEEYEAEHRRWQEERRIREEEERRKRLEDQRRERLDKELSAWKRAKEIRAYVSALESTLGAADVEAEKLSELRFWLNWVRTYAESIDPTKQVD